MSFLSPLAPLGVGTSNLVESSPGGPWLAGNVWTAFQKLCRDARNDHFVLRIESGWRSFDRQLSIWNRKARGELPLLNSESRPLEALRLSPEDRMWTILYWSALPGTSRHHWGSDLDVVDAAAIPPGYEVQLVPVEFGDRGPFSRFNVWLQKRIAKDQACGFFRPFLDGAGGVQPEPWHLSHKITAAHFAEGFDAAILRQHLESSDMELLGPVLDNLPEILRRYVYPYFPQGLHP
ncbi:MAG TPA: M15 family metallopeptidase [Fibrobacteraceae bacterium]|nr:M15 family metallopeptidase [Fibrobacteraceae bacterium]